MSTNPNNNWYKIADRIDEISFSPSGLTEIEVNGKTICVIKSGDKLFACTQKCPHAGGTMAEGFIDPMGNLVCPIHHYRFDPKNGRNTSGEGYFLKTFLIEERHNGVFVCIPGPSGVL